MLSGIRVLSFTHFLQGPSATQILGDLGAEVVKIEPPTGAFERSWSGPDAYLDGVSVFFLLGNRNARSIVIDLKAEGARDVIDELVRGADVLIESFRAGVMDRLGFGYERLSEINPGLVYASLSGYGSTGPYKDRPGQDVLIQAMSGLAMATGGGSTPPTPVGASVIDQHAAVLGALGILAALHGRERTGRGTKVESNLLSAALDLQIEPISYHLNGYRGTRSDSGISSSFYKAPYGVFRTADGWLCISLTSPAKLAAVFDDEWYLTVAPANEYERREEVNSRVAAAMTERTTGEWSELFSAHAMWFAKVNDYDEVVADPQVIHNGNIIEFEHDDAGTVRLLGHAVTYDGRRPGVRTVPPRLGADTRDVLAELGFESSRIEHLIASGAVSDERQTTDAA
ncbi:MAG: CaiB/BaiF CoA transferase family protein [Microbacterium sp.]|uniref:CaiB/BaiF CoA transferase family protein n=1 Tax=Microbacterium sp. TaxID=51671 RepID=UPI003F7E5573